MFYPSNEVFFSNKVKPSSKEEGVVVVVVIVYLKREIRCRSINHKIILKASLPFHSFTGTHGQGFEELRCLKNLSGKAQRSERGWYCVLESISPGSFYNGPAGERGGRLDSVPLPLSVHYSGAQGDLHMGPVTALQEQNELLDKMGATLVLLFVVEGLVLRCVLSPDL